MWVTIEDVHINLEQIRGVYYDAGYKLLYLHDGTDSPYNFYDPDREIYEMICEKIGLAPIKATP